MQKIFNPMGLTLVLMVCCLTLNCTGSLFAQGVEQARIEEAKRSVVQITAFKPNDVVETGAGIIIWNDVKGIRLIITAYHVVKEAENIEVKFYDDRVVTMPAQMFRQYDEDKDFAVIYVQNSQAVNELKPLEIVSDTTVKEVDKVFTIGHPGGSEWYLSSGEIRKSDDILHFAFSRESVDPGNSGGGLFNDRLQLIGLVTHKRAGDGRALRISLVLEILKNWGIPCNFRLTDTALQQNGSSKKWWYIGAGGLAVAGGIAAYYLFFQPADDIIIDPPLSLPGPPNPPDQ